VTLFSVSSFAPLVYPGLSDKPSSLHKRSYELERNLEWLSKADYFQEVTQSKV